MSLDVIADVDVANGITQAWTYYVKMLLQTDDLARNRTRRRVAVLDEPPRILFSKPVPSVDLRVRFYKTLIPEVQSAAFFLPRLGAVHDARRYIEPMSELVDEVGSYCRVIGTESGRRRNLNTKVCAVALAERCHSTTNQYALTRPNVRHYFDRRHRRDLSCKCDFCPDGRDPFHALHKPRQWRIRRDRKAATCEPDTIVACRRNGFHQSPFGRRLLAQSRPRGQPILPDKAFEKIPG